MNLIKIKYSSTNQELIKTPEIIVQQFSKPQLNEQLQPVIFNHYTITCQNQEELFQQAQKFFQTNNKNIFLGGDHSITLPTIKAFAKNKPNPGIIIFDAHLDSQITFQQNSPQEKESEDLLPGIIHQKILPKQNIILVGTRQYSPQELAFIQTHKIKTFSMKEISLEGIFEVSESVMTIAKTFSHLYVSIDADVLDPAFVSTPFPSPGGLTTRELIFFIQRLKHLRNFQAADLTEFLSKSAPLAAKLVSEFL